MLSQGWLAVFDVASNLFVLYNMLCKENTVEQIYFLFLYLNFVYSLWYNIVQFVLENFSSYMHTYDVRVYIEYVRWVFSFCCCELTFTIFAESFPTGNKK